MSDTTAGWIQQTLLPPDVIEIHLTVGVVYSGDHVQMQLEVRCPTDDTLLGLQSVPHRALTNWEPELKRLTRELLDTVKAQTQPFR